MPSGCSNSTRVQQTNQPGRSGFTLIELIIVLLLIGILSALVIPRYSNASDLAAETALKRNLGEVRTMIQVYRSQHGSIPPGYPRGNTSSKPSEATFIGQLTKPTAPDGSVGTIRSETYNLGPYFINVPVNGMCGSARVLVLGNEEPLPSEPIPNSEYGWIYKPLTMEFRANVTGFDGDGVSYYSY
ncbi:MAG: prepilin-type N-terminal cleavage/methylation domain-containing protein [Planctomycetes bacterium]|nr:prepilin-type N-terminal cleavage/methylation domain-containing protein [Planctomycetota bacterium]NOG54116.1 prepilin-type N-terminal cleavage/methylation domain-containing protein [Planctomycetota bacterium]